MGRIVNCPHTFSLDVSCVAGLASAKGDPIPTSITVLVVEDEPLIRMEIQDELSNRGFTVLEASNSREAMSILMQEPDIQVLFTDIDMPGGMDGLKLAATVHDRWPPIKIIVTSGHHQVNTDDIPSQSRFLSKPHRPDAVAAAMRDMVDA